MLADGQLIEIMYSLTGWRINATVDDIVGLCDMSPPNWYAFMGLMETYEIKYIITDNSIYEF